MIAPEPRANPRLVGHAAAEATLAEAMRGDRLHHAWLITGPAGVGKATLAYRFARRLFAGPPPGDSLALDPADTVFRRVAAATHADLRTVEREINAKTKRLRTEIVVDDTRAATEFLKMTPAEGGWRVVVVDGAEDLNRNAANALLKMLEEPPRQAVLLLTCSAPGRLLPTIRSRCRRLRLDALDGDAMRVVLTTYLPDHPAVERDRLAELAEGSPGRALALAEEHGIKLAKMVDDVLESLPDLPEIKGYQVADALGRGGEEFSTFMDLLRASLSQIVRAAARGDRSGLCGRFAALRPLDAWCDVWQGLTRLQDATEQFSLDKRQAILAGFSLLRGS